ncbi:MAG: aminotransferase class I/II-fold pyridoxal phosphate-dependent enzyme [Planctomycetota bacterium]|jgi:LL-diaminopimelate aminotransferase
MAIKPSSRIASLPGYAFADLDRRVARLRAEGFDPIDFGVGDPSAPTPRFIREAAAGGLEAHKAAGYPSYVGEEAFREAAASWMKRHFQVSLDPGTEICVTLGSKESIFNVHEAFVNPGDGVISPSPGYPPYTRGALFAEGVNHFYPLTEANDFLPDLDTLTDEAKEKAKIFWICQPHVPSGRILPEEKLEALIAFCRERAILLCSDEAYIDLYFDERPHSLIEHARKGVLVFYSLSKRSAMTGYRCGWVTGDPEAVAIFKRLKTNVDSGAPRFVQDGAVAALEDEAHVEELRKGYDEARKRMVEALVHAGLPCCLPQAGLYIWQRAPQGMTGMNLAERLLEPDLALVASPGEWLAEPLPGGENPGSPFVRFALTPPRERIEEALRRLERISKNSLLS